jgi:hypothetical protein
MQASQFPVLMLPDFGNYRQGVEAIEKRELQHNNMLVSKILNGENNIDQARMHNKQQTNILFILF